MDRHKYDTPLNEHLVSAKAMCAFRFGLDKICLFEIPDFENIGYICGYVFYISGNSYFHDIAGGSDGLSSYAANTYAKHLADRKEFESLEPIMGEDDLWILDDDTSMDFHTTFVDAMDDAGFVMRDDGGWARKDSWNIHELLDYLIERDREGQELPWQGEGQSITVQTNEGMGSTCRLAFNDCNSKEDIFMYEDAGTEKCQKTRSELIAMYPNNVFTEDDNED